MSIFRKLVKGSSSSNSNNPPHDDKKNQHQHSVSTGGAAGSNHNNSVSRVNTHDDKATNKIIQRLEEQVKILNTYIQELAKENESLQDKNGDMRTTLH
jgi:predicted RNase H-like nuclease (RuvC/YqgF family)